MKYGYDAAGRLATVHAEGYGFHYDYVPHSSSDRVKTVTAPFVKQIEFTYERGRDSIASVANRVGFHVDTSLSEFTYSHNADGQLVEKVVTYGAAEAPSLREGYEYDPDTGGVTDVGVETLDLDLTAPEAYGYAYDKIRNRLSAFVDDETTVYQGNALNQYSSIDGRSASYDADGILTAKDGRTYRWDAENRLIAIQEHDTMVARYTYDHQSRRIARETAAGVYERYLYDGWNLIAIYRAGESQPAETYTWGKDLSGTLQGAGGVGGLLFAKTRARGNEAWIYHFDANGNVTEVTSSRGKLLDRFAYDAFGNLIDEPQLLENRYRFSTKPLDSESGFHYYGCRYYAGVQGRWLRRDPSGEKGGRNLYRFVGDDPVNGADRLGMITLSTIAGPRVNLSDHTLYLAFRIQGLGNKVMLAKTTFEYSDSDGGTTSNFHSGSNVLCTRFTGDNPWTFEGGTTSPASVLINLYKGGSGGVLRLSDSFAASLGGRVSIVYEYKVYDSIGGTGFNATVTWDPTANATVWHNEKSHNKWAHSQPATWNDPNVVESGSVSAAIAWNCPPFYADDFAAGFSPEVSRGLSRQGRLEGEEITNVMSMNQLDNFILSSTMKNQCFWIIKRCKSFSSQVAQHIWYPQA